MKSTVDQILELVGALLRENPDYRFGQLICNLPGFATGDDGIEPSLWDIEDEQLLDGAKAMKHAYRTRSSRSETFAP